MKNLTKKLLVFLVLLMSVVMLTGCGKKNEENKEASNSLIGTWVDENETYTYEYKEDGKAVMNGKEATYSIEGDTLTIKYEDSTKLYKYKYTVNNTSLTLENEEGSKFVYVKK